MENKCLVTRLAGVASDATLPVFNAIKYTIDTEVGVNQNYFTKWTDSSFTKLKIQNGYFLKDGKRVDGITTDAFVVKAVPNTTEAALYLMNKENLVQSIVDAPFNLRDLEGCHNLVEISCRKAYGDIAGLSSNKLREIGFSNNANVYGDLSRISPSICQITSLHLAGAKKMTYTKGERANSNNIAVNIIYPIECFATLEDVENYLIASAKCAFANERTTNKMFITEKGNQLSRKAREAVWYLTNKMYANIGDTQRTNGTYFTISGVDISDITADPNWQD